MKAKRLYNLYYAQTGDEYPQPLPLVSDADNMEHWVDSIEDGGFYKVFEISIHKEF